jgi:FixJ family two-component response regulator
MSCWPEPSLHAAVDPPVVSIVDDDVTVRRGLEDLVSSFGYAVLAFDSAEAFMSSGRIEDTACLITDVQMPGWSGLDLQAQLVRAGHRTSIIFLTACWDERSRDRAMMGGAVHYLTKPVDEGTLYACIRSIISR